MIQFDTIFISKTFKIFLENYRFYQKSANDANSTRWGGGAVLCVIMTQCTWLLMRDSSLTFILHSKCSLNLWLPIPILFHTVWVRGHYFVQCRFIQVCIFYRFFWKKSFFIFVLFLWFLPVTCRIGCNLHKFYNIYIIIVYIVFVKYSVFLLS